MAGFQRLGVFSRCKMFVRQYDCGMIMAPSINGMTVRDAATRLGVSVRRVLQLVEAGTIRGVQINPRMWILDQTDVARYAASDRKPGRPPVQNS